jgi:hypothetical protein
MRSVVSSSVETSTVLSSMEIPSTNTLAKYWFASGINSGSASTTTADRKESMDSSIAERVRNRRSMSLASSGMPRRTEEDVTTSRMSAAGMVGRTDSITSTMAHGPGPSRS